MAAMAIRCRHGRLVAPDRAELRLVGGVSSIVLPWQVLVSEHEILTIGSMSLVSVSAGGPAVYVA